MLLVTESTVEFDKLRDELLQDIQPQNAIERRYAEDVAYLTWEVRRYRAAKNYQRRSVGGTTRHSESGPATEASADDGR